MYKGSVSSAALPSGVFRASLAQAYNEVTVVGRFFLLLMLLASCLGNHCFQSQEFVPVFPSKIMLFAFIFRYLTLVVYTCACVCMCVCVCDLSQEPKIICVLVNMEWLQPFWLTCQFVPHWMRLAGLVTNHRFVAYLFLDSVHEFCMCLYACTTLQDLKSETCKSSKLVFHFQYCLSSIIFWISLSILGSPCPYRNDKFW